MGRCTALAGWVARSVPGGFAALLTMSCVGLASGSATFPQTTVTGLRMETLDVDFCGMGFNEDCVNSREICQAAGVDPDKWTAAVGFGELHRGTEVNVGAHVLGREGRPSTWRYEPSSASVGDVMVTPKDCSVFNVAIEVPDDLQGSHTAHVHVDLACTTPNGPFTAHLDSSTCQLHHG